MKIKYFMNLLITPNLKGTASHYFVITPQAISVTGVKIVNYCSPLYFANAEIFRQKVIKKVQ